MLKNMRVGLCITGSFCNFAKVKPQIDMLKAEGIEKIIPIVSYSVLQEENRYGTPEEFIALLKQETGEDVIDTISKAEPIGPEDLVDIMVVAPCTGNTVAKLAHGITDTPVLMAIKSHIRNNKPLIIGVSTNDALGANGENILKLLNTKNIYFIPSTQDNPEKKPKSLVYDYTKLVDTMKLAVQNKQIVPLIV